ncbi:hypothetical protein SAMN05660662_2398 [Blastococcus aurantiacus]|uniref:Uncharacterized protein n=1 Tax=Blastococcus aurantiacus TaxID=1550231 RepID=A0A1G7LN67_9ACTN|nr:hypothetical protein [Blastococcus aurantiacus]SDF50460.1 hypothetical protein SAMN05660662_2398 [Blastococcus aurantiacus]
MTDRTHDDPPAPDDRTRDITLPPLPDRPPPALPKAWAGLASPSPLDSPTTAVPGPARPPAASAPEVEVVEEADPAAEEARRLARSRTDEMLPPPSAAVRERTLAFSSPEMRHRPIEPVRVDRNPRRWPWVVLTLLPILVILASAIGWLILLRGS